MDKENYILLTIDVEDWFQVENFKPWIPFETWDQRELRVERNVHHLLNLFDSVTSAGKPEARGQEANRLESYEARMLEGSEDFELPSLPASQPRTQKDEPKNNGQRTTDNGHSNIIKRKPSSFQASQPQAEGTPKATFFVLGWLAERLPHLIREIHSRGHEVASHGYNHNLCNQQSDAEIKQELTDSKKLLEDIIGSKVFGYRAPNFSINDSMLKIIEDSGYVYDSSYNSFHHHSRYGKISLNGSKRKGIALKMADNFYELPISNIRFRYPLSFEPSALSSRKCFVLPWGGGAYFRLIPYRFFKHGVQSILKKDGAYVFYTHPWELDPEQPRVNEVPYHYKLRHYKNIKRTSLKLSRLVNEFEQCKFITCSQYLASQLPSLIAYEL
jgi:polysaccharide deacetylase family protein (PEP-CTERM system associated)